MWNLLNVIVLDGMLTLAVIEYLSRSFMFIDSLVEMLTRVTNIAGITPATFVDQRGLDFFMFEIFSNFSRNEDWAYVDV